MEIYLYCSNITSRLTYVAEYLFEDLLGLSLVITANRAVYHAAAGLRCNYSTQKLTEGEVWIFPHSLLFENDIRELPLASSLNEGIPVLFPSPPDYTLSFDVLAASFFVLSRYEEYLPFTPDAHDRYPAEMSWAYRNGCLAYPVIWEWAKQLRVALQPQFTSRQPKPPGYRFQPTYDIDLPWAYQHRGVRGIARAGLDLLRRDWQQLQGRWNTLTGQAEDPFATFTKLRELHEQHALRPRIFWLLADASRENTNPNPRSAAYRQLLREVSTWSDAGIHPGYDTYLDAAVVTREKDRLAGLLEQEITHARQHFLRLKLPDTYRVLSAADIRHDYTMGYASQPGYRAGTSQPFRWYDLERDEVTDLLIHPFAVMDVTLKQYLQLDASAAHNRLEELQTYCRDEGLTFCTLWHNSSFSTAHGWAGWWEVYARLFD